MRLVTRHLSRPDGSPDATQALALDLADVKVQRRLPEAASRLDGLLESWITAAAQTFEIETTRQLITASWELWVDCFPCVDRYLEIPKAPLVAVSSVLYDDADGAEQTLSTDDYTVIAPRGPYAAPGRIVLNDGVQWPTTAQREKSVRVQFTAGYGASHTQIPQAIKAVLYLMVGTFHRYGETVMSGPEALNIQKVPLGAEAILRAFAGTAKPTQRLWEVPWQA